MKLAVIALLFLPAIAQAQVYKCVASDGSTSYATIPCPEGTGESTRIIEPVPPSGALNIPYNEQAKPDEQPSTNAAAKPSGPTVTGILTVIPDSEDPRREQKREEMREDAAQHKRDLYKNFARQQEEMSRRVPGPPPQQQPPQPQPQPQP